MIESLIATWPVSTQMRGVLCALVRGGWDLRLRRAATGGWTAQAAPAAGGGHVASGATAEHAVRALAALLDAQGLLGPGGRDGADPAAASIATWPVPTAVRTTLFALEQLGWRFDLERLPRGRWRARAETGAGGRECHGATPELAVRGLLEVLAGDGALEEDWHVVVRRPGAPRPVAVHAWPARRVAERHARELAALHPDASVFLVRLGAAGTALELAADPGTRTAPDGIAR